MESPLLDTYTFRRRAKNEAWSGRTAKAGKNFKGNLKGAIQYALNLSREQGGQSITVYNEQGNPISKVNWLAHPELLRAITIQLEESLLSDLLNQEL